uniref:Uncharacterized protein n=1 Tax=Amblyomma maculatum TaxID=34609 RepID=G3MQV5_AMBMU
MSVTYEDHNSADNWYRTSVKCTRPFSGKGYAKSYNYKCRLTTGTYPEGMPCMPLTNGGQQKDDPGLCKEGRCTPLSELLPLVRPCVHPLSLHQCEDMNHEKKDILRNCYYYCRKDKEWYYGYYASNENSVCLLPNENNSGGRGWCCRGSCIAQPHCGTKP